MKSTCPKLKIRVTMKPSSGVKFVNAENVIRYRYDDAVLTITSDDVTTLVPTANIAVVEVVAQQSTD